MSADAQTQYDGHKLFVGGLPATCTEDEIKMVFGTYGTVKGVVMLHKAQEITGLRSCFVFYEKQEAADTAIKVLNGVYKIREDAEQPIKVGWAKSKSGQWNTSVAFEGPGKGGFGQPGFPGKGAPAAQSPYGFPQGMPAATPQMGCGNPCFQQPRWEGDPSNWAALGGCPNMMQAGDPLATGLFQDNGCCGCGGAPQEGQGIQLYVANLPDDIQQNALEFVFGTYGKVNNIHIMNQKSVNGRVSAFVYYNAKEDAESAISALHDKYEIRPGYGFIHVKHANAKPRAAPY